MKRLLILLLVLPLAGCSIFKSGGCEAAKSIAGSVASGVAVQLDCKNPVAIQNTIMDQLAKTKVCEAGVSIKSPIGDFVCAPVIDALIGAVTVQIPAEWECSGGPGKQLVKDKLLELCRSKL